MYEFEQNSIASLKLARGLIKAYNTKVFKKLGQNFLINQKQLFKFIDLCEIKPDETIIEIGPGIGTISFEICKIAKKVILIELDKTKEQVLQKVLENFNNYEIIWEDATKIHYENIFKGIENVKIIGSLPFNVSKKIIYNLLTTKFNWRYAFFIVQKEVGEEYTSSPPKSTFLHNFASLYSEVQKGFIINKINYYPVPKVDSMVIKFKQREKINYAFNALATNVIKQGFRQPRKNILNNLKILNINQKDLEQLNINNKLRPAQLELSDWYKIINLIIHKG